MQVRVRGDDDVAQARERAPLLAEEVGRREQGGGDRGDRARVRGRARERAHHRLLQPLRAVEQHLALVGEMAEERARGQPCALGNGGHGGLFVADLAEQFDGGLAKAARRVRLPATHDIRMVLTLSDIISHTDVTH